MPDIPVGSQIFDLAFHPTHSTVYTGLLNGKVKAFRYDEQGQHEESFVLRPSKRSCRCLDTSEDGSRLWATGKAKAIFTIDTTTGTVSETRKDVHDSPVNRIKRLMPQMLGTGDDDGVIKLWDPRKSDPIRSYTHHYDFISDFLWLDDKKQLITTSGSKVVVGTQMGILSVFNRSHGWGDCVDRVPGHPQSIDALCTLPSSYPSSHSTILTGSSDGLLRAVQLFPTKLLGVVADHGSFPIERIAVDLGGEGRWVGSAGHDDTLKMTDLRAGDEAAEDSENVQSVQASDIDPQEPDGADDETQAPPEGTTVAEASDSDEDVQDSHSPKEKKRKLKSNKNALAGRSKKAKNQIDADPSFFKGL
ncbi:WD40-repeat-containing domain protein [Suillus ampliporus]|nr:WD40-repeat-containing domain protein [Suillus ampliporus]